MADGIHALTEKEKAALRLLLAGHDAKSMASHLGLSVHTVNERLRDCRRKLAVSSSKAAARLLRDAEAATPQILADKPSGAFPAPPTGHSPDQARANAGRIAWTIGGPAMIAAVTITLAVAALAVSSLQSAPPGQITQTAAAPLAESDASSAARDWLALVDARNWRDSWAATGAHFRQVNTVANWQAAAEQVHARRGPARSRQLLADEDIPAPPNGLRTVRFRTVFTALPAATETLSLSREGDRWRVVGIYLE